MYLLPCLGVLVFETQVLQFRLDGEETEPVRQRSVYILRLAGDLVLLVFGLRTQCPHVMQPVGNLNQHHADVVADGQQQFAEVLRLLTGLRTEHTAADLRQTAYYLGNLLAEQTRNVLLGVVRVFDYIVQQRSADARAT